MKQPKQNKSFKPYKITTIIIPGSNVCYYHVYHFGIGFGATFNNLRDVYYWLDGFSSNFRFEGTCQRY